MQHLKRFTVRPGDEVFTPLPKERVNIAPPFQITGLDYAGPIKLNDMSKAYILIFTCAVTRAIHLELCSSMKVENFIASLRRFIARRGAPSTIISDNAKTFKRANKELKLLFAKSDKEKIEDFIGEKQMKWKFIVERAPWWGGFWERMIRSVKTCLKKKLRKAALNFEDLQTNLIEVEAIINSRPLTYNSNEMRETLTPSHFLSGKRILSLPVQEKDKTDDNQDISKRWKHRQQLMNGFWTRWKKEYLLELRNAHQSKGKDNHIVYNPDDVVLIQDENQPRLNWKLGRIISANEGRDKKVRSCLIALPNGNQIRRPIQRICHLELHEC